MWAICLIRLAPCEVRSKQRGAALVSSDSSEGPESIQDGVTSLRTHRFEIVSPLVAGPANK